MSKLELPHQIKIGSGSLNHLDEAVIANGGSRAFVIIDSFLSNSPIRLDERVKQILKRGNIESVYFSDYSGEPTTEHISTALEMLREYKSDCVVGIGGGSAIDLAKAVSLLDQNPDLSWSAIVSQPRLNRLPLIAVPTTAGTGSEATKVMVITNVETNVKMNPGHPHLIPDAAILDPELTLSLPRNFTSYTGMDALAHAMEAYVSNRASVMTNLFAMEAIRKIGESLPRLCEDGKDLAARESMLLASCYAGIAFSNASTNLAHAAGRPLGAYFHIPHGLSIALLLPFVIEFGLEAAEQRYADVAIALGADRFLDSKELAFRSLEIIRSYNDKFEIWDNGRKYIEAEDLMNAIPILVQDAMSGNGIATNLRVPNYRDVSNIYERLAIKLSQM